MATDNPGVIAPTYLIVPTNNSSETTGSAGSLIMSGAKMYIHDGTKYRLVTSAA